MDERSLAAALEAAGITMPVSALRAVLDGVVAAPAPRRKGAWIDLVAPSADAALRAQLAALEDAARASSDAGFLPGPAPAERLDALRAELVRRGLDGFIVPRTDAHQGEFVPAHDERLRWLTGFTGSAGVAVVLANRAAIFVDGRYTVQVQTQVDTGRFEACHLSDQPPTDWIAKALPKGARLGYDPWLQTEAAIARYRRAVRKAGGELVAVADNPIDSVWVGQPAPPISPAVPHDIAFTGETAADKRARVGAALAEDGADAAVLTLPDSIAWLLNIRGADVPHTPLALSFAILHADGTVDLFIDPRKLAPGLAAHLGNGVRVETPEAFPAALEALGADGRRVLADPDTAAALVFERLAAGGAEILRGTDPCLLPKACKSAVEIAGTKGAHRRDGAALTRFLAWFAVEAP
ncbi:MAG: aminopeptidase P family N-terminal domain-containing protein, partial [Alphaproteobacteria bacterium]